MSVTSQRSGNRITISIAGEFGHESLKDFRHVYTYQSGDPKTLEYVVDFDNVTYISSTGAGMLLALHDHCGRDASNISVINVKPHIAELLSLLQFEKIFKIEHKAG